MPAVYLSLGSNLGDRGGNIQAALMDLEKWGVKVVHSSSLYEAEPVGMKDQPWFLNMVLKVTTGKTPEDLLMAIRAIECALGRERKVKWGPRTIDIDILLYDGLTLEKEGLMIPHPRMQERRFVLEPLAEIAPDLVHPVLKKTVAELLKECTDKSIVRLL